MEASTDAQRNKAPKTATADFVDGKVWGVPQPQHSRDAWEAVVLDGYEQTATKEANNG